MNDIKWITTKNKSVILHINMWAVIRQTEFDQTKRQSDTTARKDDVEMQVGEQLTVEQSSDIDDTDDNETNTQWKAPLLVSQQVLNDPIRNLGLPKRVVQFVTRPLNIRWSLFRWALIKLLL